MRLVQGQVGITPRAMVAAITDPYLAVAKRAFEAMGDENDPHRSNRSGSARPTHPDASPPSSPPLAVRIWWSVTAAQGRNRQSR